MLRVSTKAARTALACTATIGVILAVGAGSAFAATWSPSGPVKETGTLTLKLNGGSPKVCQVAFTGTSYGWLLTVPGTQYASCEGGTTFSVYSIWQEPMSSGGGYSVFGIAAGGYSPYGQWDGATLWVPDWTAGFTNPVVSPSANGKIVFQNTLIGHVGGTTAKPLTLTGTLDVTTATGGPVRINP